VKKLIIVQTVTPDYRAVFFDKIHEHLKNNFELYSGNFYFEPTVVSSPLIKRKEIKNYFFFNRKVLFQSGIWHLLFKKDILVLGLNPRVVSNWIFLLIRKILNKETYLWGHAWGRKGVDSNDVIRNIMRVLATGIIVYTKKQKKELEIKMPTKNILSAPNSLYEKSKMLISGCVEEKRNIISVGRLVATKKNLFLVKSFSKVVDKLPKDVNLIIVGDGDERKEIEEFVNDNKLNKRVSILGHIGEYEKLKQLYSKAFFSISAGYVGLSAIQSFSFGVPMIISKNEKHSPEIEAVKPSVNAVFFNTDDQADFGNKLLDAYKNKDYWNNKRKEIVEECINNYSSESMAKVFIDLLK